MIGEELKTMLNEQVQDGRSVQDGDASVPHSQPNPQPPAHSHSHSTVLSLTRFVNPLVLKLAGTRWLPLYGVIEHRGRRSGKVYRTPIVVRPTRGGFIVPMPFGASTDWYRNVRAAGECTIRWKGHDYRVVQPELIADLTAVRASFNAIERAFIPLFRIKQFLHLRIRR